MNAEQAIERLKDFRTREKRRALPDDFNVYVEHQYNIDALDMAIEALSKQCASSEQAGHIADLSKKVAFKPGDKFLLELGAERKMFGEFEIAGTDLYVKVDLLEKLSRYEPKKELEFEQPEIKTDENNHYKTGYDQGFVDACKMYEKKQPERKTGHWIHKHERTPKTWECSECGYRENIVDGGIYKFCSACGAKMEVEPK